MLLLAMALIISNSSAANIALSSEIVFPGQTFDLNVSIDPLGKPIAGAQLDLAFNRSLLRVNRITEGNLFRQNGSSTFFNSGVINNLTGTAVNIFDAIIGRKSVSTPGTFIVINMTATGLSGTSCISLSNMKISGPSGASIPFSIKSGNVTVAQRDAAPPAGINSLRNITYVQGYIKWSWNDPADADFAKVMVYINSIFRTNVTKGVRFYNATGLTPNTAYTISTHTVDASGNINKTWINHTARTAPSITVVSPNGGENWARGTIRTIRWTSSGSPGANVKIELLKAGVLNRVITSSTANDGSHSWAIPSTQTLGTDFKIRVTSTANSAYTDTSNNNFTINSSTHKLLLSSPTEGRIGQEARPRR